jgi:membrane protease YdiL (CAAX protease family)
VATEKEKQSMLQQYFTETNTYVYSLIIILPLILLYETAVLSINRHSLRDIHILANELIVLIFEKIGFGYVSVIPAFLVLGTLFILQMHSKKKWEAKFSNILLMYFESVVYGAIFFLIAALIYQKGLTFEFPYPRHIWASIGAGIYEEYIFRLLLLSSIFYIFKTWLKVENKRNVYAAIIISAVCFAAFHYLLDSSGFELKDFLVITAAGIYFGFVFFGRGYGVAAGTHIVYNILFILFCS